MISINEQLVFSIEEGSVESILHHIQNGADVNGVFLNTPMLLRSLNEGNCNVEVLQALISAGANVQATSHDGANALLWLVEGHDCGNVKGSSSTFDEERIQAIKLLLDAGADPLMENNEGLSAYNYSEYSRNLFDELLNEASASKPSPCSLL